jgi:hypothetical protein
MTLARLMLLAAFLSLPAFADNWIEWDCGSVFGACGSTVAVDPSQNPTTYIAQNISVIVPILNAEAGQPNATDTFSLAFQVNFGNFSNVIDQTLIPNQNYGATISNIQVYEDTIVFPGDTVLSFDTYYAPDTLPLAYQTYLGSSSGSGYDLIDFKTTPTQDGGMDYTIDGAHVIIDRTPEPGTLPLLGITLAALVAFSLGKKRSLFPR